MNHGNENNEWSRSLSPGTLGLVLLLGAFTYVERHKTERHNPRSVCHETDIRTWMSLVDVAINSIPLWIWFLFSVKPRANRDLDSIEINNWNRFSSMKFSKSIPNEHWVMYYTSYIFAKHHYSPIQHKWFYFSHRNRFFVKKSCIIMYTHFHFNM